MVRHIKQIPYSALWLFLAGLFVACLLRWQLWQTKSLENWAWWHLNRGLATDDVAALATGKAIFASLGADNCEGYEHFCALLSNKLDATNYLVNGGFEFNQQAWVINLPRDVSLLFSASEVYKGSQSLGLSFHGPDVNFYHIYQEAVVLPGGCYELTAHIRAEGLTGEVGLDVWDAERGYRYWYGGQTQLVGGTVDWTPVYLPFCTPDDVLRIQVRLRRFGGRGEGVMGWAWFDDVRLEKAE